jgi:hypothetical protein
VRTIEAVRIHLATATAGAIALAITLTACAPTGSPVGSTTAAGQPASTATDSSPPSSTGTSGGASLSPPRASGLDWHVAGSLVRGQPVTYVATTDAGAIGLMWIDPTRVDFRLVPGRKVPEGGPSLGVDNQPQTWVPRMVAAFNGGFLLLDHVGGYYYAHRTVAPLRAGLGALEITTDGRLQVGQWGRDLTLTTRTVAVRENLPLLVDHFRAMTRATDTARTWGLANGGLWTANRSALGEMPDGSLVYAYGHDVRPSAMARALTSVGVQRAMVLDMNKSWPGGFVYWRTPAGLHGSRIQPQEYHAPSVYYARYTKDFVVVLAR